MRRRNELEDRHLTGTCQQAEGRKWQLVQVVRPSRPLSEFRFLSRDASTYMHVLQWSALCAPLALLASVPALAANRGGRCGAACIAGEYTPFLALGVLSGLGENATWTSDAMHERCDPQWMEYGRPLFWGRPGGMGELLGT